MTLTWGPLGWTTLHTIAALYPDEPTQLELALIVRWIEAFRQCIVCEKCKTHFTTLLKEYQAIYPNWNSSRKNLSLFVLRAHNTVNVRQISKPALTMEEAFIKLRENIDPAKANLMRQSYVVHIRNQWVRSTNMDGIRAAKYIRDLIITETDYWATRSFQWDEISELVKSESIAPLPSKDRTIMRSIPLLSTSKTSTLVMRSAPQFQMARPRFSFVSR